MVSNSDLLKLMDLNPSATIITGDNVLFVDTGAEKLILNVAATRMKEVLVNVPNVIPGRLADTKQKAGLREYKFSKQLDLNKPSKLEESQKHSNPKDYQERHKATTYNYPEVAKVKITGFVNDFFTEYFTAGSELHGKGLSHAYAIYSKKKMIATDDASMKANKYAWKQVQKTFAGIKSSKAYLNKEGKTPLEQLESGIGVQKTLKAKVALMDRPLQGKGNKVGSNLTSYVDNVSFDMTQKVLDTGNSISLFTDKTFTPGKHGVPDELIKIGATVEKYYKTGTPTTIYAPDGVHKIITHKDYISVDGFQYALPKIAQAEGFRDIKNNRFQAPLAHFDAHYVTGQEQLKPQAIKDLVAIARTSIGNKSKEAARKGLTAETVGGLKKIVKANFGESQYRELLKFDMYDDHSIAGVLRGTGNLDVVLDGARSREVTKLDLSKNSKYKEVIGKANSLGIPEEDIMADLDKLVYNEADYGSLTAKKKQSLDTKAFDVLKDIENTLDISIEQGADKTRARSNLRQRLFSSKDKSEKQEIKKKLAPPPARDVIKALRSGPEGAKFLDASNILSSTLENPALNLEGNFKSNYVNSLANAMFKDALIGQELNYDRNALAKLGGLLSKKDLAALPQTFASIGSQYLPTLPERLQFKREEKQGVISESNKKYRETLKKLNVIQANISKNFGGEQGQAELLDLIATGGNERKKTYESAEFDPKPSVLEDFDGKGLDADYAETVALKSEQALALKEEKRIETKNKLKGTGEKLDTAPDTDFVDNLNEMTDDELGAFTTKNKGYQFFNSNMTHAELAKKVEEYTYKLSKGALKLSDFSKMQADGVDLGYTGANTPKDILSFMTNKVKVANSELYGGIESNRSVRVGQSVPLRRDLWRHSGESLKRVDNLGLGLAKQAGNNKLDYSRSINMAHGTGPATSWILGPKGRMEAIREGTLSMLGVGPHTENEKGVIEQLRERYTKSKAALVGFNTSQDEVLHNSLAKALRVDKQGNKFIDPSFDVFDAISTAMHPDNQRPYITTPGDQYYGMKDNRTTRTFGTPYFDPDTRKFYGADGSLTTAQKNEALSFIDATYSMDDFKQGDLLKPIDQAKLDRLVTNTYNVSNRFVTKQVGRKLGVDNPEIALAKYTTALQDKIIKYGEIAYEANKSGNVQTATAYKAGIEKLYGMLAGSETTSSLDFVSNLIHNPDEAINKVVMGKASSTLRANAVSYANVLGAELVSGGDTVDDLLLRRNQQKAEKVTEGLLQYKDVGYRSNRVDTYDDFRLTQLKNINPEDITISNLKHEMKEYKEAEIRRVAEVRRATDKYLKENIRLAKASLPKFKFFNTGGKIPGKGVKDEVPALLTKGETVVDRDTSEKLGIHSQSDYERFKQAVSDGKINKFASGGGVYDFLYDPLNNSQSHEEYIRRPTNSRQAEVMETNRIAKSMTLNLAAGQATINMKLTNAEIGDNIRTAESMIGGADKRITSEVVDKASGNFAREVIGDKLKLDKATISEIFSMTQKVNPLSATDMTESTYKQIQNLNGAQTEEVLNSLKHAGIDKTELKQFNKGLAKASKTAFGDLSSTRFNKSIEKLDYYADTIGKTFSIDGEFLKGLKDVSTGEAIKRLEAGFKGVKEAGLKTNAMSVPQMRESQTALNYALSALDDKGFGNRLEDEKSNVLATRDAIGSAKSLREHAQSRVGEFGALTLQNAAFGMSYAIIGGVQQSIAGTIGFVSNFSDSMKNLQAITGDTDAGLNLMSNSVKRVSTETKFSALEIGEAATILGQAGFSAVDISKSLGGVVELATATGSSLDDATQILTSTLTIWDKSLTESKKVSNEMTAAINESKLDITSLTQAVQYTGNIAASAGIASTDVLTMTSLLKDAGIKRGSTLGTGQRLLYGDFVAPSKKFISSLKSVGIELDTFAKAFDEEGVYGALKLMKDSGYGLAAASRGMEVREKSIYIAAMNQLDKFKPFREDITGTNAAYIANKTQMEGMGNAFKNMLNSWQINLNNSVEDSSKGFVKLLKLGTIDIPEEDPKKNISVKGYTLEEKLKPKDDSNGIVAGVAGLAAIGHFARQVPAYLDNLGEAGTLTSAQLKASSVLGGARSLVNKVPKGALAGIAAGATISALNVYTAPEGNKAAAATSGLVGVGAYLAANSAINKIQPDGKFGATLNKMVAATALSMIDQYYIAPEREKGTKTGIVGTGAMTGAFAAMMMPGGPIAKGIAGVAGFGGGALAAGLSETDAGYISYSKALSEVVNSAKGLSSELTAVSKSAQELSNPSNFAYRSSNSKDLSNTKGLTDKELQDAPSEFIDRSSKLRATVSALAELNSQVTGLEAATGSNFNLGAALAATPAKVADASTEQIKRAEERGSLLPSIEESRYEYLIYKAKDGKVVSGNEIAEGKGFAIYEGQAADAAALSARSLATASFRAANDKEGASGRLISQLSKDGKPRDFTDLKTQLEESKNFDDVEAVFTKSITKPTSDAFKSATGLSIKHAKGLLENFDEATKVGLKSLKKSEAYTSIEDKYTGVMFQQDKYTEQEAFIDRFVNERAADRAGLLNLINTGNLRSSSSAETIEIGISQVKNIMGETNPTTNAKYTAPEAYKKWNESSAATMGKEKFASQIVAESGINDFVDVITENRNKVKEIDTAGLNLVKKLDAKVADSMANITTTLGPALTEATMSISKELVPAMRDVLKSNRETISTFGDLSGKSTLELVDKNNISLVDNKQLSSIVKGEEGFKLSDIKVDIAEALNVTNIDKQKGAEELLNLYTSTESFAAQFVDTVTNLKSIEEARATGDMGVYGAFKNIALSVKNLGIKDMASFKTMSVMPQMTREEMMAMGVESMRSFFTEDQLTKLDNKKASAIASMELKTLHAEEVLAKNVEFKQEALRTNTADNKAKLSRGYDFNQESIELAFTRQVEDINKTQGRQIDSANRGYQTQLEKISIAYSSNINKLARQAEYNKEDVAKQGKRGLRDINLKDIRGVEDIATSEKRGLEDIDIGYERASDDLQIKLTRGFEDITKNTSRAFEDLQTNTTRSFENLVLKTIRGFEDIAIKEARGSEDIGIKEQRGLVDIANNFNRNVENLNISKARGQADIVTSRERQTAAIELSRDRAIEDLYTKYNRSLEDIDEDKTTSENKLALTRDRNIEDAITNFNDNIAKLNRSFSNTLEALDRSRQDTIDMFERSLNRPQVVTLDTNALTTIANNLGNVDLALDAHKAALAANTSAVMQNNKLQQTQEDIAKAAYKDAYKKVGGKVYNDDGTVNDSFNTAYNDYMAENSEALIDAVLENALSKAYSGIGFDVTQALDNPAYLAGQVSAPTPSMTMAGAVAGSSLSTDELVKALYDIKSGEVRVTTTTGVIIDAKGEMSGALYDLKTALLGVDIKVREAGISFSIAVDEAGISLANNLRDIEIAYQRGLEDLDISFANNLDKLSDYISRGMEDINTSFARNMEDLVISLGYATEDLATKLARGLEDAVLANQRALVDLADGISRAREDLAISLSRAGEDLALSLTRGVEDLAINFARAFEDIETNRQRAIDDLLTSIARAEDDLELSRSRSIEDLTLKIGRAGEDLALSIARAKEDLKIGMSDALIDIQTSLTRGINEATIAMNEQVVMAGIDLATKMTEIQITAEQNMADALERRARANEDLDRNYDQQLSELDIAIQIAFDNIKTSFEKSQAMLRLNNEQNLQTLELQMTEATQNMFNAGSEKATQLYDSLEQGFTDKVWNASKVIETIQRQLDDATKNFKIDAEYMLEQVAASLKTAFSSKKLENIAKIYGDGVADLIKDGLSISLVNASEDIKEIYIELGNSFKKDVAEPLDVDAKLFVEGLKTTALSLGEIEKNLKTTSLDQQVKLYTNSLSSIGPAIGKTSPEIEANAIGLNNSVITYMQALNSTNSSVITSGQELGSSLTSLASTIAAAAYSAIQKINIAVAAAAAAAAVPVIPATDNNGTVPTYSSEGTVIPGYGGGDILPFMLEPGEAVVRKEVVKSLGADTFNNLNEGINTPVNSPLTNLMGLPSKSGNGIMVNMSVQAGAGIDILEQNMERIADGVKKVFEEYS